MFGVPTGPVLDGYAHRTQPVARSSEAFFEDTEDLSPRDRFAADLVDALGVVASDEPGGRVGSGGHS